MRSAGALALATCLLVGMGCERVPPFSARPLAWPNRAYGGETVSVAISSNNRSILEEFRSFDASTENILVRLQEESTGVQLDLPVRAIVSSTSDLATPWSEANGATEIQIAVFDLPTIMPFSSYPTDVDVIPIYASTAVPVYEFLGSLEVYANLQILAETGGDNAINFWPTTILQDAEPLPSLRLRSLGPPFDPAWTIGSVQFDVAYPSAVSNPRAFAKSEAAGGVAYASELAPGSARVVLLHPGGFHLPDVTGQSGPLGGGPFLDLGFDKTGAFQAGDFTITNLLVTDIDGDPLLDQPGDSSAFFQLIARRNQ